MARHGRERVRPYRWGAERRADLHALFARVVLPRSIRAATVGGRVPGPRPTQRPTTPGHEFVHSGRSPWNASWNEPRHTGGTRRLKSRRGRPGRTPEGVAITTATGLRRLWRRVESYR